MTDRSGQPPDPWETDTNQEIRRQDKIHRGWIRERERTLRKLWGADSVWGDAQRIALLAALYLGCVCQSSDLALWWPGDDAPAEDLIHRLAGPELAVALVLLSLLSGLLLDLALTAQTGSRSCPPAVLRWLRFSVCCLPLLGMTTPLLWYRLVRQEPAWPAREETGLWPALPGVCYVIHDRIEAVSRWVLSRQWTFFWVLVSHLILPWTWIFWLVSPEEITHGRYAVVVVTSVLGHLLAFASAGYFFARTAREEQLAGWRRVPFLVLPLFWLVPLPLFFFLGVVLMLFIPIRRREETLVGTAHGSRESVTALDVWRKMESFLRQGWRHLPFWLRVRPPGEIEKAAQPGVEQTQLLWLYKAKSSFLLFDAMALTILVGRFPEKTHDAVGATGEIFAAAALGAFAVGGIALTVHLVAVVLEMVRAETRLQVLILYPYAFYLGITQLVSFMGCLIGVSLQGEQGEPIAGALLTVGSLGMLARLAKMVLPLPVRIREGSANTMLWLFLFSSTVIASLGMVTEPKRMQEWMALLELTVLFGPIMSVLLGISLVAWLLRPFDVRQIFSREIPLRRRLLLAALALTAVAPLGGLFVPLWIYVRHRRWPVVSRRAGGASQDA